MASYRGHIVGGLAMGALAMATLSYLPLERSAEAAQLLYDEQVFAAFFVLSVLFALFPDVDTNSKGQDIFIGLAFFVDVLLIFNGNYQAAAYLGLIAMLPILSHHRGWTHSKWAMFLVPSPLIILPALYNEKLLLAAAVYYIASVGGYFSHLLLDGLIWKRIRIRG
jgi:membrane-bound metal-dependent hydrolase YbcI (DUF457 family)